jgi:hypothetical protein
MEIWGEIGIELPPGPELNLQTNYEGGSCYIPPAIAQFFPWHPLVIKINECLNTHPGSYH